MARLPLIAFILATGLALAIAPSRAADWTEQVQSSYDLPSSSSISASRPPEPDTLKSLQKDWEAAIIAALNNVEQTRAKGCRSDECYVESPTHIQFTVLADGTVKRLRLKAGSGNRLVDQAAFDVVRRMAKVPAPDTGPDWEFKSLTLTAQVPVR